MREWTATEINYLINLVAMDKDTFLDWKSIITRKLTDKRITVLSLGDARK